MSATTAASWTLEVPQANIKAESAVDREDGYHGAESIIGEEDLRELVPESAFLDGGKYRSIVKIQSRFQHPDDGSDIWMIGTGWLIASDVIVTAGHVVFDHAYGCGPCTQLKCYIGYNGTGSVPAKTPTVAVPPVQARHGSVVVTTQSWIKNLDARPYDVAFIRVAKQFTGNLNIFKVVTETAPAASGVKLGVVGYPGDKMVGTEKGAQMYELFETTSYDLDKQRRHMIAYPISTYGGQSGAPVLLKSSSGLMAIGTHCYGAGDGEPYNSGNSIGGRWGNDYPAFRSIFSEPQVTLAKKYNTITYIPTVPTKAPKKPADPSSESTMLPRASTGVVEEGFLDVLRSVAKIGAAIVPIGGALLGPVGGIVGTAAGGILGAIAGQESTVMAIGRGEGDPVAPGAAERALLSEAALQAVLNMTENSDHNDPIVNSVLAHMSEKYTVYAPNVDQLATRLAPQLTECALDIANHKLRLVTSKPLTESELEPQPRKPLTGLSGMEATTVGGPGEAFIEGLLSSTLPLPGGEEGAFDFLGPLISKGVKMAIPLVSSAAKTAVTNLLPVVVDHIMGKAAGSGGGTESVIVPTSPANVEASRLLFKRAVIADASLSALMALPREQLDQIKLRRFTPGKTDEQEGLFDFIKSKVQDIGPFALDAAKNAVSRFAPVLIDAAAAKLKEKLSKKGTGSTPSSSTASGTESTGLLPGKPLSNLSRYRAGLPSVSLAVGLAPISRRPSSSTSVGTGHRSLALGAEHGTGGWASEIPLERRRSPKPSSSPAPPLRRNGPVNPDQPPIMTTPPPPFDDE